MKVALTFAMLCAAFAPHVVTAADVRWCCVAGMKGGDPEVSELDKCNSMIPHLNAEDNDITWSCVEHADCHTTALQDGHADIVSLDSGDLFSTSRLWDSVPVLAEDYSAVEGDEGGTSYHTVVAMNADECTDKTTLASLKGKKACGTGYRKTAGWRMPIGTLLKKKIMPLVDNDCLVNNDAESAAAFFEGMCAPGVALEENIGSNTAIGDKLCSSCKDPNAETFCVKGSEEYSGYEGALKCMIEDSGDVAFIKHTTMDDYPWTGSGKTAANYKLLCPQGGCVPVTDYLACKWATVPSHAVVVNPAMTGRGVQVNIRKTFAAVQLNADFNSLFGFDRGGGPNVNTGDLVFKGSAYRLKGIDDDMTGFMGSSYGQYESLAAIEDNDCSTKGVNKDELTDLVEKAAEKASDDDDDDGIPSWGIAVIVVISLICAGMLALILAMMQYEKKGKPLFQPLI